MSKPTTRNPRKSSRHIGKSHIDRFCVGDIWESPRGERHSVIRVSVGVATLFNESAQCKALRADNDFGWGADRPWVRVFSASEQKLEGNA